MTRKPPSSAKDSQLACSLDAWLHGDPLLDDEAIVLLVAYRDAVELKKPAAAAAVAPPAIAETPILDATQPEAPVSTAASRGPAIGVGRLDAVEGVPAERFSGLHGQLLAAGYLVAELHGRAEGLTYRITREGLQRLSGGIPAEAA